MLQPIPVFSLLNILRNKSKVIDAHKMYPERYYAPVMLPKNLYASLKIVAAIEQTSKRKAAIKLLESGLSKYMAENTPDFNADLDIRHRKGRPSKTTRPYHVLKNVVKEKGLPTKNVF